MRKIIALLSMIVVLLSLSACEIWFFPTPKPVLSISNASAIRDEVTDLPLVTVNWKLSFPSDAYPQTADAVSVVCSMTQRYVTGPRSFTGAIVGVAATNKGPFTGSASILVPEDGRYVKGTFYVMCRVNGIADETVSNEISVTIPPSCQDTVGGGPTIGNSFSFRVTCPTPTPTATTPTTTTPPVSTYDYDKPFRNPQYLIHATGHGTTSGNVVDDFYFLYTTPPDAQGNFLIPDGSGGTFGYSSDYHSGPYTTPRQVCSVVAGRLPNTQSWAEWNYSDYFDCTGIY